MIVIDILWAPILIDMTVIDILCETKLFPLNLDIWESHIDVATIFRILLILTLSFF